jgi:hypothetical protein
MVSNAHQQTASGRSTSTRPLLVHSQHETCSSVAACCAERLLVNSVHARARVLRSLLTKAYWSRSCTVDPAYGWFLEKVKAAVDSARLTHSSDTVGSMNPTGTPSVNAAPDMLDRLLVGRCGPPTSFGTYENVSGRQVTLLAHSAGGWLARAFLADERYFDAGEAHAASTQHNRCHTAGYLTLV